ncbi:MAG: Maf family protein, partial [Balneolaceae bacterium]
LASKSPRRKRLLELFGIPFDVVPSGADESISSPLQAPDLVRELSRRKARAVANLETGLIIGADTIVVKNGTVLGQPDDPGEARKMLGLLSGTSHDVYTGVTLIDNRNGSKHRELSFQEKTRVWFARLLEEEIEQYILRGNPFDKAGGYGIQDDLGALFVSRIDGDYYNVVGFPVHLFYQNIKTFAPDILNLRTQIHDTDL